jgi:predicted RNase H-like HicB family nuclease
MTKYKVDFSVYVPEWGTVDLDAESVELAEADAMKYIEQMYPEAIEEDIFIDEVTEVPVE